MSLDKHWRDKWAEELKALGHDVPDEWTKDEVKAKLNEVKGLHPQEHTKKEASSAIQAVADERVKQLEAQMSEMKAMLSALAEKNTKEGNSLAGLTGDDLVKAIRKAADGRQDEYGLIRAEWIPEGDEIPIRVYYMAGPTTNIWGKTIGNTMTPPPLGKKFIKFQKAFGWVSRGTSGIQQRQVSTFECRSKTLADWIESLPDYGRTIYLNMDGAMETTVNGEFTALYNKHFASLSDVSFGAVTNLAKEMGCATNMGFTHADYARFIAEKRALTEMEASKKRFEDSIRRTGVKTMVEKAHQLST